MRILRVTASFVAEIEQRILACNDADFALRLAQWLARFLTANFCGIYQFKQIEEHIAQKLHDDVPFLGECSGCVHVASEVYPYGGHSRLMRNLLAANARGERHVVLARPFDTAAAAAILDVPQGSIRSCREISETKRAVELASLLLSYQSVVLHIHPDDVVTAVAIALAKRSRPSLAIYFVNHSDHTFSAAIGFADFVFEVSGYGWSLRAARGIEYRSTFLGIPLNIPQQSERKPIVGQLLTGGSAYKYQPSGARNLPRTLSSLLDRERCATVVAIGPRLRDAWWWPLKARFRSRFVRHARIPHAEYVRRLGDCSVYVDSYPVTGGTGFTEALIAGADVAGISGGPNGYGLADVLRSKNAEAFIDDTVRLLRRDPLVLVKQAATRERARELHSLDAVHARFMRVIETGRLVQPPVELLSDSYEFDFREQWKKRSRPAPAGFAGRRELSLLPVLLACARTTLNSRTFAAELLAKAFVGASREFISSRRTK
jgi:hypothetical protein